MDRIDENFLRRPETLVPAIENNAGETFGVDESDSDVVRVEFELAQTRVQIEALEKKLASPTIDVAELVVSDEESLRAELQKTQAVENASLRQELERLRTEEATLVAGLGALGEAQGESEKPRILN